MHTTTVLLLFASFQAQMHTNTTRIVLDFYILTIGDAISCWCVEHLVDMKIIWIAKLSKYSISLERMNANT